VFLESEIGIHLIGNYEVVDVVCCRILIHPTLGVKCFPGTLVTTAPVDVIEQALSRLR